MTFTQNQFFIYTKKVFVSLEFNFCLSKLLSKFILQDSFLCLVIRHQDHLLQLLISHYNHFTISYSPRSVGLGSAFFCCLNFRKQPFLSALINQLPQTFSDVLNEAPMAESFFKLFQGLPSSFQEKPVQSSYSLENMLVPGSVTTNWHTEIPGLQTQELLAGLWTLDTGL